MNKTGIILIGTGLAVTAAAVYAAPKISAALDAKEIGDKADFNLKSFKYKKSSPGGGSLLDKLLKLNFNFQAVLEVSNPTTKSMVMDQPYLNVYYKANGVGNSDPATQKITVAPNAKTELPVNVTLFGSKAIGAAADLVGYIAKRIAGITVEPRPIQIKMQTAANGFPVEKTFNVNL